MWLVFIPAIFFGWALGANDAANIFGPSVGTGVVRYRTAIVVTAIFVITGAMLEGARGLETISNLSVQDIKSAGISALSAAISVALMTYFGLPVSSSQAIVGSIVGIGLLKGQVNWGILVKVLICWVTTPFGAVLIGYIVYKIITPIFSRVKNAVIHDRIIRISALVIGAYGAYALGANNVANITGVFVNFIGIKTAAFLGGVSIALGVLTYSYKVMMTVGKKIILLDHTSSLVAVLAESITVWIYALIGVPVSTSQAIVGGVIGAGLSKGSRIASWKMILRIVLGWVQTPTISGVVAVILYLIFR